MSATILTDENSDSTNSIEKINNNNNNSSNNSNNSSSSSSNTGIRVWADGCYDLVHYGHANSIRQAKSFGDYLVVGAHSDEDISKNKGLPVLTEIERYTQIRALRWVDQLVEGSPFSITLEIMDKYGCEFTVHGNDISLTSEGHDAYLTVKSCGRYRECQRAKFISTTELVERILQGNPKHHMVPYNDTNKFNPSDIKWFRELCAGEDTRSPWVEVFQYMPNLGKIDKILIGQSPLPGQTIGYVTGAWDMFHLGHVNFLKEVSKHCDYIVAGVYNDDVVNAYKGHNYPILNIQQRLLGIAPCRYINAILVGAPFEVNTKIIDYFKIDTVFNGLNNIIKLENNLNPYSTPKENGILKTLKSGSNLSSSEIVRRILDNRITFEERNRKKMCKS